MKTKMHTYHFHTQSDSDGARLHSDGVINTVLDPETEYMQIRAQIGERFNPPLEPEAFTVTSFTRLK